MQRPPGAPANLTPYVKPAVPGAAPLAAAPPAGPTPLLQAPSTQTLPNCATVAGLPWFFKEEDAMRHFSAFGDVKLLRCYEDPLNGRSRGIFLVGFGTPAALSRLRSECTQVGPYQVTVSMWCLSQRWHPATPPPPIPGDTFNQSLIPRSLNPQFPPGAASAENTGVRGVILGEANTATIEGFQELERARKKHRAELGIAADPDDDAPLSPTQYTGGLLALPTGLSPR